VIVGHNMTLGIPHKAGALRRNSTDIKPVVVGTQHLDVYDRRVDGIVDASVDALHLLDHRAIGEQTTTGGLSYAGGGRGGCRSRLGSNVR